MTPRWLAESLDGIFIEFGIRTALPVVTRSSRLTRLHQAETRTRNLLPDAMVFPAPSIPQPVIMQSRIFPSGLQELTQCWQTPVVPLETVWFPDNPRRWLAKSLWFLRASPRPLVVLVGGWMRLHGLRPEILWPIKELDRAGFDTVVPILMGNRAEALGSLPSKFPSCDPSRNIIELARTATTIGQLLLLARECGHPSVRVWGTSLGAHVVALFATLPAGDHGDFCVLEKPLSRLSDPLRLHGHGPSVLRSELASRLDQVYRSVSPLDRPACVHPKRLMVIGGEFDRVTPISNVQLVATHFDVPLCQTKASHLLDPNRSRRMLEVLTRSLTNKT